MNVLSEMLSYPFMVRALFGGMLVSLCASLLGVSLVLKRYSMIGDGLSHVSFGALSIALAMGWSPLKVSIPVVVLAAFFLLRITENSRIKSDAAIAMISASSLAIGIIVTSLTTGMTTDVSSYMFGSILAMTKEDVMLPAVLCIIVLGLFVLCYNQVFAYEPAASKQIAKIEEMGFSDFPVCMAKNQYSLSDDANKLGRPKNFDIHIREVYVSAGAGFVVALTGAVMTMPGLPKVPAANGIDVTDDGKITGLF